MPKPKNKKRPSELEFPAKARGGWARRDKLGKKLCSELSRKAAIARWSDPAQIEALKQRWVEYNRKKALGEG